MERSSSRLFPPPRGRRLGAACLRARGPRKRCANASWYTVVFPTRTRAPFPARSRTPLPRWAREPAQQEYVPPGSGDKLQRHARPVRAEDDDRPRRDVRGPCTRWGFCRRAPRLRRVGATGPVEPENANEAASAGGSSYQNRFIPTGFNPTRRTANDGPRYELTYGAGIRSVGGGLRSENRLLEGG